MKKLKILFVEILIPGLLVTLATWILIGIAIYTTRIN